ncbi:TPA: DUF2971 domain-containing protein [Yersinia enterocolitica]
MLYKFFTLNDNSLSSLYNSSLWFSKVCDFNDPFEGQVKIIDGELTDSNMVKLIKAMNSSGELNRFLNLKNSNETLDVLAKIMILNKGETLKSEILRIARHAFNTVVESYTNGGACCFVSDGNPSDDSLSPLTSRLMWGHYDNGLRGFALKFRDDIFCDVNSELKKEIISGPYKIDYINDYPVVNLIELSNQLYVEKNELKVFKHIGKLTSSKNKDWEYEQEVRYISMEGNRLFKYSPEHIELLCIGEKMPNYQVKCLLSIAKELGIKKICRTTLSNDSYTIGLDYQIS